MDGPAGCGLPFLFQTLLAPGLLLAGLFRGLAPAGLLLRAMGTGVLPAAQVRLVSRVEEARWAASKPLRPAPVRPTAHRESFPAA